jgi:hypothetical protein
MENKDNNEELNNNEENKMNLGDIRLTPKQRVETIAQTIFGAIGIPLSYWINDKTGLINLTNVTAMAVMAIGTLNMILGLFKLLISARNKFLDIESDEERMRVMIMYLPFVVTFFTLLIVGLIMILKSLM